MRFITEKISGRRPRAHRRRPCPWTGSSPGPGICAASRRCMFQTPGLRLMCFCFWTAARCALSAKICGGGRRAPHALGRADVGGRTAHPGGFLFPAPDQRPACGAVRIQQLHLGSLCAARTARRRRRRRARAYASLCLPGDCYVCHRVHAPWPRGMQTAVKSLSLEVAAGPRWMPVGANSPSTK